MADPSIVKIFRFGGGNGTQQASKKTFEELMCVEPYRTPTQVVGSRRPRRTSERSSRNSAKKRP